MNSLEKSLSSALTSAFGSSGLDVEVDTNTNKFYYSKFRDDLSIAVKYEKYIRMVFEEKGWQFLHYCNNNRYDILMEKKGKKMKIEVKTDNKTLYTPNIIFEYKAYDEPSGIKATEADLWVYVFPGLQQVWFIKINGLKELIEAYNPEKLPESDDTYRIVAGGDGSNTRCYLWDRNVFQRIIGKDCIVINRVDIP